MGAQRPAPVSLLAAIFAAAASLCVVAVLAPPNTGTPLGLLLGAGAFSLAASAVLWFAGARVGTRGLEVAVALGVVAVSVLIAHVATGTGQMVVAFMYVWMVIYAAVYFSKRAVIAITALIAAGFGLALIVNEVPTGVSPWFIVSSTVVVAAAVLNRVTLRQRRLAVSDPLTGLLNRNGLWAAAERERTIARRSGEPITVALLDLDGFKAVNDQHGHAAGDRLLVDLGTAWRGALRARDVLARTGGDEFAILMPATAPEEAETVLARLREAADRPWSAGLACWRGEEPLDAALARADRALYSAKPAAAASPATPAPPEAAAGSLAIA